MTNRREFIGAAVAAASSAALLRTSGSVLAAQNGARPSLTSLLWKYFPAEQISFRPDTNVRKVIVIGAGCAGLTAARILHDAGIDTTVLEGRERIGGRTWTVDLGGGVPVDMNGGYLHDLDVNRLAHLYDEAGWAYDDAEHFDLHSNGYDATTGDTLGVLGKVRLAYHLHYYFKGPDVRPSTLVGDYPLEQWTRKYFQEAGLTGSSGRLIESLLRSAQSTDGSQMSTYWYGKTGKEGGKWVFPRGGFKPFIDALAKSIDVRTLQSVHLIELQADTVRVTTQQEVHEASHVIVTVPLGVLQTKLVSFQPELPADKLTAMDGTGFAKMEKFAILLDDSFADDDFTTRVFFDARNGCRLTFQNLGQHLKRPVLVAYAHTDYVTKFIQQPREQREAIVMTALRLMLGRPKLEAKMIVQSNWSDDPYSKGAYSFIKVHGGPQLMNIMARPEYGGRLMFAGEATDFERFAYVDGAVATGVREARRLLANKL